MGFQVSRTIWLEGGYGVEFIITDPYPDPDDALLGALPRARDRGGARCEAARGPARAGDAAPQRVRLNLLGLAVGSRSPSPTSAVEKAEISSDTGFWAVEPAR